AGAVQCPLCYSAPAFVGSRGPAPPSPPPPPCVGPPPNQRSAGHLYWSTRHTPSVHPLPCLAPGGPDAPPPTDAAAVARDWPAAGRPARARRTPGSDVVARVRREHPRWTVHRPTTPRSSPPTTPTDPSGPTASRCPSPRPT